MSPAARTALVTGASRGIGRATAEALAATGADLLLADCRSCEGTAAAVRETGVAVRQARFDAADESSVRDLFCTHVDAVGRLDFLVHCAGVIHEKPLLETGIEEFDRVIGINLRGSFLVGREALRRMHQAGAGRVVMVASDLAYLGRATFSPYVASKCGVLGLVRCWALEFAPAITVNALCPGPIDTAMLDLSNMSPEWRAKEMDNPQRRVGTPDDAARMAVYLCGPGGDFITGQGMSMNGGSVMR